MTARKPKHSRRGGIYLIVMIGSATVTSIALVGLSIATERRQAAERAVNAQASTQLAHAAIEMGIHTIATDHSWRWSKGGGWWFKDIALEDGIMALGVTDREGGDVTDGVCRAVVLRGVGIQGTSRTMLEVELEPETIWPNDGLSVAEALGAFGYWTIGADKPNPPDSIGGCIGIWKGSGDAPCYGGLSCTMAHGFNGSDDYVEIKHKNKHLLAEGSISLWFLQAESASRSYLFTKWNDGIDDPGDLAIALSNGTLVMRMRGSSGTAAINGSAASLGEWHHMVATFGSGGVTLYLDGVLQGSDSTACNWLTNKENLEFGDELEGSISHASIFDRVLSEGEVATLYDALRSPPVMRIVPGSWRRATE